MKIRKRSKFAGGPISLVSGDTLEVRYRETDENGKATERVLVKDTFDHAATYDEAFTFDEVIDGRPAIGGGIIEVEKK